MPLVGGRVAVAVAAVLAVLTRPVADDATTDETIQGLLNA